MRWAQYNQMMHGKDLGDKDEERVKILQLQSFQEEKKKESENCETVVIIEKNMKMKMSYCQS